MMFTLLVHWQCISGKMIATLNQWFFPTCINCSYAHDQSYFFHMEWHMKQDLMYMFSTQIFSPNNNLCHFWDPVPNIYYISWSRHFYLTFTNGSYYNNLEEVPGRCSLCITPAPWSFYPLLLSAREGVIWSGFLTCFEIVASLITPMRIMHGSWRNLSGGPLFPVIGLSRGGSLFRYIDKTNPWCLCFKRLDFAYWPRGRSLATFVAGYISVCPRDMSIGWVCPLWEACFLPSEVYDLSYEVCCPTRLSCNFASYFSLWKSLRVSCTTLLSHITPLGTLALLCFALVCYLEYTLLSASNS